jgi:signal recognition particle receptor subunit beta
MLAGADPVQPGIQEMPTLDKQKREITCKVVYYGPGVSGKTTNLQYIHSQIPADVRSQMVSTATQTDRTLFFDFMPLNLGVVAGWKIRLGMYTVPGQVEYNASRRVILNGADAIVFVADSDALRMADNLESMNNMRDNLSDLGMDLNNVPWVLQYNKRDLDEPMPLERMEKELNLTSVPSIEAIASQGLGVFTTLKSVSKLLINDLSGQIK